MSRQKSRGAMWITDACVDMYAHLEFFRVCLLLFFRELLPLANCPGEDIRTCIYDFVRKRRSHDSENKTLLSNHDPVTAQYICKPCSADSTVIVQGKPTCHGFHTCGNNFVFVTRAITYFCHLFADKHVKSAWLALLSLVLSLLLLGGRSCILKHGRGQVSRGSIFSHGHADELGASLYLACNKLDQLCCCSTGICHVALSFPSNVFNDVALKRNAASQASLKW